MIGVREDGAPHLFVHAALGQDGRAFDRVPVQSGMNLPIEIVQQCRDAPALFILAELAGVRRYARLDGLCVVAEPVGFREFAENIPGCFAIDHSAYDIPASPHAAWRAVRNRSRSRLETRTVWRPSGVQVSSTIRPGCWRGRRTTRDAAGSTAWRASAT